MVVALSLAELAASACAGFEAMIRAAAAMTPKGRLGLFKVPIDSHSAPVKVRASPKPGLYRRVGYGFDLD